MTDDQHPQWVGHVSEEGQGDTEIFTLQTPSKAGVIGGVLCVPTYHRWE